MWTSNEAVIPWKTGPFQTPVYVSSSQVLLFRKRSNSSDVRHLHPAGVVHPSSWRPLFRAPRIWCQSSWLPSSQGKPNLTSNGGQFVDAGHRQRTITHSKADSLGRTRANVARRQNSRNSCFKGTRLTVSERPAARTKRIRAGKNISELVSR